MHRSRSSALAVAAVAACGANTAAPSVPSCPADRDAVLSSHADVAQFASCTTARGVTIRTGAALELSRLHALATITGDLVIGPTVAIESVAFPELRVVDGAVRVAGNGLLQALYFPRLERAGRIAIEGNAALTTISLPRLAEVQGALRVTDNASLESLDISALASIAGDLTLAGDPRLNLLEATQLQRAGAVHLDAPMLPPDVADGLHAAAAKP